MKVLGSTGFRFLIKRDAEIQSVKQDVLRERKKKKRTTKFQVPDKK